ncbi:hypothetical protein [Modicisalibacter muralis]|uniref:hypothetical protein n=1 Tax=Modicisalibacter muralis TaxID=119000 RepID=UPI000B7CD791|nr:hypothetical protein [Halomonas muralis]
MHDSVAQAHHLIGARLRDPQRRSMGQVVGVDQTRDLPALLIIWEGQVTPARVPLSVRELHELVQACVIGRTISTDDAIDGANAVAESATRSGG